MDYTVHALATSREIGGGRVCVDGTQFVSVYGRGSGASCVSLFGKFSHADVYGDAALFQKVWKKLLRAAAFEAIGERTQPSTDLPTDIAEVSDWLNESKTAKPKEENLPPRTRLSTRRSNTQLRFETHDTAVTEPIHLSILAQ